MQPRTNNIKLTERHLVDEAEVTLHHLGPGQSSRRITRYPVETICPHGVTVKSWVVGGWSLSSTIYNINMSSKEWRDIIIISY